MISDKVRAIIGHRAPLPSASLHSGTRLVDDLGYDSLAVLEAAFAIEAAFNLPPLSIESLSSIVTVGDVEDLVARMTGGSS